MDKTGKREVAEQNDTVAVESSLHPKGSNPWKTFAGIWKQNPDFEEFLEQIKTLRQESNKVETEQS